MDFTERIAQLSAEFLQQSHSLTPTEEEFVGWVDTHGPAVRPALYRQGSGHNWQQNPSYQNYVLTARGYSVEQFIVGKLSHADYLRWVTLFGTTTLARES